MPSRDSSWPPYHSLYYLPSELKLEGKEMGRNKYRSYHSEVRLRKCKGKKGNVPWWNRTTGLAKDERGRTLLPAVRLNWGDCGRFLGCVLLGSEDVGVMGWCWGLGEIFTGVVGKLGTLDMLVCYLGCWEGCGTETVLSITHVSTVKEDEALYLKAWAWRM